MINALPYILLVIFYGGFASYYAVVEDNTKKTHINLICVVAFVLFFGFRGLIFYDWSNYYPEFNSLTNLSTLLNTNILKWQWEPGFMLLILACKTLTNSFQFSVFICCLLNTILLVRFLIRYTNNLPLGIMIFLSMNGITISTDLMRNSIAILIFLNAIPFLENRKLIPYMLLCLLASTFHISALAYIPLYFILHRKINKKVLLILFITANIIYLLQIPIFRNSIHLISGYLMPKTQLWIDTYMAMDSSKGSILSIGYIERLITGILLFCYIDKLRTIRPKNDIFINSLFLFLIIFLSFSEFRTISMRSSLIFSYGYWIIWIDLIKCFHYRKNRYLFITFLAVYSIFKTIGNCHSDIAQYYNVLFEQKSYNERLIFFRQHFNDK